ncbi:MAG: terpene cyclase/mutase family protein, partial [Planctomycetaceae bacterium]|nr:terpene cyclase/mutase family protein [Planctomycetaceae bacterium]
MSVDRSPTRPARAAGTLEGYLMRTLCWTVVCSVCLLTSTLSAAGPDPAKLAQARNRGADFLRKSQSADGSWTSPNAPGISGLCTFALLRSGVSADDPSVAKGLKHLQSFVRDDGGIYAQDSKHRNYETSIALQAFQAANVDGRHQQVVDNAVKFLRGLQWDEEEQTPESDPAYGGQGYGSHQRPDLSNTAFFIEALRDAGIPQDDPAIQKAMVFVSRCQNMESAYNTTPFARQVNDGGFYYTPAAGGSSQAGLTPDGGLRSYASMTYAGLKSMIYAGVKPDDPRVKAASDWVRKFYSIQENPGMGQQGLFYYYHTFAKALSVMGVEQFEDADGVRHDWRQELASHLESIQLDNGSWVNSESRW